MSRRSQIIERPELHDSTTYRLSRFSPLVVASQYPLILLESFVVVSGNLSRRLCFSSEFIDACTYSCTIILWQPFDSTAVVSSVFFDLLEPSARSGIMICTSTSAFDSCPHLSSLSCCRSHTLPTPPRVAFRVCCPVVLSIFIVLGVLAGVSADFHALSRCPCQLHRPLSLVSHPGHFVDAPTSVGNATISLVTMASAITTISAASPSYSHGSPLADSLSSVARGSSCVTCDTTGTLGESSLTDSAASTLTCPQLSLAIFFVLCAQYYCPSLMPQSSYAGLQV